LTKTYHGRRQPESYSEMGSEKFSNSAKSGYNKGTIRSDIRYLVVSKDVRRHRLISIDYITTLPCHGRGREFESRRPRHSFQKSCTHFAATNEGAKGHVFAPFLHPFSSIRAVFTGSAFTGLTTLTRVRWSSFQKRRPAQGPLLAQRVLLARLPACKHPAWTVMRNAAATPASL
jgi:hypothetical protein